MITRDQLTDIAFQVFLSSRPKLQIKIKKIINDNARGLTIEELRFIRIAEALEKEADRKHMSPWDYQLKIVEASGLDVSALRCEEPRYDIDAIGFDRLL